MMKRRIHTPTILASSFVLAACGGDSGPTSPPAEPDPGATQLVLSEIGAQMAGVPFHLTVTLADAQGEPVTATGSSTISLDAAVGSGSLRGVTTATLASGSSAVTFSGIAYDGAEQGVRLRATGQGGPADGLVGVSDPFTLLFDFDEARIAFRRTGSNRQDIFLLNGDGTAFINLTDHPAGDTDPVWSPDGARIAWVSNRSGKSELYVMNVDGTGLTQVTNDPGSVRFPSWSPDGSMIAFSTTRGGQRDLFAVPAPAAGLAAGDGYAAMIANQTGECRLTNDAATDNEPVWVRTSDGDWIFFFSTRDANDGVFRMEVRCDGGAEPVRITLELEWACSPASGWSLQSNQLRVSVVGEVDGQRDIYVMDTDGSNVTNLTDHAGSDFSSSWTTGSLLLPPQDNEEPARLIFDSRRSGRWQLYSVREDGSGLARLTDSPYNDEYPSARPMTNGAPLAVVAEAGALGGSTGRSHDRAAPDALFDRGPGEPERSCGRD
jgi:Tol biopolymer transport system component